MTLSIEFNEFIGKTERLSPQFGCTCDGPTSTRYYLFDWEDVASGQAMYEVMGYPERTGAGVLSRHLPERDPQLLHLWANGFTFYQNIGSRGFEQVMVDGMTRNVPVYANKDDTETVPGRGAIYRCDFSWRPYDVHSDDDLDVNGEYGRFVEVKEDGQTDYITPASLENVFRWAAPGVTDLNGKVAGNITNGKLIPYANVSMVWHQVPYIYYPRAAIAAAYGKVTKTDLGAPDDRNYYKAGTLLFLGSRRRRYMHPHPESTGAGQAVVDLEYFFRHDPGGNFDIAADCIGPNTFPCFVFESDGFNKRFLISKDGLYYNVGSRDGVCMFDEFTAMDLFTVE